MAYIEVRLNAGIFEDANKSQQHSVLNATENDTHTEFQGRKRVTLADGTSDVRLDPYDGVGALEIGTIKALALTTTEDISIKVGTTADTATEIPALTSGKGFYYRTLNLARNATTGIFLSNASGADATIEFLYSGD